MKKLTLLYISILFVAAFSCDDILETEPLDELPIETALGDLDGLNAGLLSAYDVLQDANLYGRDLVVIPELLSDNMRIALQNTNRLTGQAVNQERAHIANWDDSYDLINRVNNVLKFADQVEGSEEELNRIKGEAYFLRALTYHNLVKAYARDPQFLHGFELGVPLVTTAFTSLGDDSFPERATVSAVYTQIKEDLAQAISLLNNDNMPYFGSQVAAKALLARVYLHEGSWEDAANTATEVIDEAGFNIGTDYEAVFSDDTESLFSVQFVQGESLGPNNALQAFFITSGDAVWRQDMIDVLDTANDNRADLRITVVQGPETVVQTTKFNGYQGSRLDNVPVLRLSEMLLIRAEANVENGTNIGDTPVNDLNQLRDRAGLADLTTADIDDVMLERRKELAFEGHRFWDLKRKGMNIPKGVSGVDCVAECSISNDNYRVVAAIAQGELDTNDNLVQNPEYN